MRLILKQSVVGVILTMLIGFALFQPQSSSFNVDRDDFKEWLQREIENEVREDINWGNSQKRENTDIVLRINSKNAVVNEEKVILDVAPFITNEGRTLVPVRFVSEVMGDDIKWKADNRQVIVAKNIVLQINNKKALVSGKEKTMDVAPIISNGRTMVPIRFISEKLGYDVNWDEKTQEITIRSQNTTKNSEEITYKNIDISDLSEENKRLVQSRKHSPGHLVFKEGNKKYVAIFLGQRPSSGYSVKVNNAKIRENKTLYISVSEIRPDPRSMDLTVITYPFSIVEIENTEDFESVVLER